MYYIYSSPGCSACENAAKFLEALGEPYQKVDLFSIATAEQAKLMQVAGVPFRTVPQIFKSNEDKLEYVGGYDQLRHRFGSADGAQSGRSGVLRVKLYREKGTVKVTPKRVFVKLTDGTDFFGTVYLAEDERLQDICNDMRRFLPIERSYDNKAVKLSKLVCINKQQLLSIEEV